MLASLRAGFLAALVVLLPALAQAAHKAYQRDDLADAAIRLEAQIKSEAGAVTKPAATLRREAEAAFQRQDSRTGLQLLGQLVTAAPNDAGNWLRLARTILQIQSPNQRERTVLLERAATAAYIAYERATTPEDEAESLLLLSRSFAQRRLWRPALDTLRLSLELREVAEARAEYERLREQHGFRLLDYTVDSDSASPRICFQFSEELPGRRTDFTPFVAVMGNDRPALSVEEKQLCVEGLKHGERYTVTLRAGLPSVVKETLPRSAEFNIYVRDRRPFARFSGRAYVLPRTGQRGIPVVTTNTRGVSIEIYRIGDRNLTAAVLGSDFQRNLDRYDLQRIARESGAKVWSGELATEMTLNADVVTAFPVDQAVGDLAPGVYLMTAEPKGPKADDYESIATQWFIVSDLGMSAFSGGDGVHAFVHSLATGEPKGLIQVRLIARNNEVLATRLTNANGHAQFEAGLARGEGGMSPALLVASDERGDYAFLSLKAPPFDLSDRGVAGRPSPSGLDAFVYTERGVYRSGETVHITALLRDPQANAAAGVPLTLVAERPDGVEYRRLVLPDQGLGGRTWSMPITASAPTGTWRLRAYTDPKRPPVGETTFLVEDYVPDRLEFELATDAKAIGKDAPIQVSLEGRYLYGAPASGLDLEGEISIAPVQERPGLAGYRFGQADEEVSPTQEPLADLPATDEQGRASFTVALDKVPSSTQPLEARITIRMAETGGRAVERKLTLPVTPTGNMIGVKPLFSGDALADGDTATFDVVVAAPDGSMLPRAGLRYELLKVETRYQWYRQDGRWEYEPVKRTRRVADGTIDVAADRPGRIAVPVSWGRYRLDVSTGDAGGPLTSITFNAGFYADAGADTPDLLEVALDKPEYRPGETMTVVVTARSAGRVSLYVIGERLLASSQHEVEQGTARLTVPVGSDWGSGAYLVATLRRPLDTAAQRMPGRAIGVQWFAIDRQSRTLGVDMRLPDLIRPNTQLRVPVRLAGLAAGEDARVVVAAVDVGILNLTNYKPPSPDDYYLGQRRLGAELRDLYGQLIDGMQGTRGQIRSGGDMPAELQGSPPAQKPVALYSGIVRVGPDGSVEVPFDVPEFAGTLRVMAVAWSKDRVGHATGDVIVRDPVVLTATLPRFLLAGDQGTMHLELDNVEGPAGEYTVQVEGHGALVLGRDTTRTLQLAAKQRAAFTLPLNALVAGSNEIQVQISGPNNLVMARNYALTVKPATQILTRRTVRRIAPGESLTLSSDLFADLVPGSGSLSLSVARSTALDAATVLKALDRYPFGCTEQIVSRALPLLYANELAAEQHLALDADIDQRIRDAIDRALARQDSNGSFGLWGVGGDDVWLDAYVTDFLTRARERNFAVPDTAFRSALDRLRNFVSTEPEPDKDGGRALAYALYVLARNGAAPIGDLRYIADTKLDEVTTAIGKAQIAAALGLLGDRVRAERAYRAALQALEPQPRPELSSRQDYGSALRDAAAMVTLASEGGAPRATVQAAVQRVEAAHGVTARTSTQENAWLVLAARAIAKDTDGLALEVNGEGHKGALYRTVRAGTLQSRPLRVTNTGAEPVQAVLSVNGAPVAPEPAAERGFKIERSWHTLDGEAVDIATVKQNQRFVVVLKITEAQPQFGRIIVADYLPAGFEIDNPRLVSSGDTGTLDWIEDAAEPVHSEFRDDRFTAAFERKKEDKAVFSVAYVVRAVSPGKYVVPQAFVEDMYRPERFGRTGTASLEVSAAR